MTWFEMICKKKILITISGILLLYFTGFEKCTGQSVQFDEFLIESVVKSGEIAVLHGFIDSGLDVNFKFSKSKLTLLQTAINASRTEMVSFLLKEGADPNKRTRKQYPLMLAINQSNEDIVKELLDFGADSLIINGFGYKYLEAASKSGNLPVCLHLIRAGAYPGDFDNQKLLINLKDVAGSKETREYFTKLFFLFKKYPKLPDFTDGPYINCLSNDTCEVINIKCSRSHKRNVLNRRYSDCYGEALKAIGTSANSINSIEEVCHPDLNTHYFTEYPILALGDFHGDYKNLTYFLKSNNVIDENQNWIWGRGNLIITGDIFDRGDYVTECIWLIIKLQMQADRVGGKVHFLLGNHEIMALNGNTSYLSDKYTFITQYFNVNFKNHFDSESVFGKWLRSRNSIIKINNILFLHAGISEKVFQKGVDIDSMNVIIRNSIQKNRYPELSDLEKLIVGMDGPLWYRGYMGNYGYTDDPISQEMVNKILDSFKSKAMVIAHSEIENISVTYDGKVFGIDVLIVNNGESVPQGLLIENNKYYRLFPNGVMYLLHE